MKQFEVAAAGFDASTDETDNRIVWVSAEDEAEVQQAIAGTGARCHGTMPLSNDTDFTLPYDVGAFRATLWAFASQ